MAELRNRRTLVRVDPTDPEETKVHLTPEQRAKLVVMIKALIAPKYHQEYLDLLDKYPEEIQMMVGRLRRSM